MPVLDDLAHGGDVHGEDAVGQQKGQVLGRAGLGRGGKPKDEDFRPAALTAYVGKRARKGRKVEGFPKPMKVVAL